MFQGMKKCAACDLLRHFGEVSNCDAMEDYIWSRDYIDAMGDFEYIGLPICRWNLDRLSFTSTPIASSPGA